MRIAVCIIGIVVGLAVSLFGIVGFVDTDIYSPWTSSTEYETYGGDAYTGIQNAVADTANNVEDVAYTTYYGLKMAIEVISVLVFMSGFGTALVSTYKLADIVHKKRGSKAVATVGNITVPTNSMYAPVGNSYTPIVGAYAPISNVAASPTGSVPVNEVNASSNEQ